MDLTWWLQPWLQPWLSAIAGALMALAAFIYSWTALPKVPEQYRLVVSIAIIGAILAAVLMGLRVQIGGKTIIAIVLFLLATASLAVYIYQLKKIHRGSG